MSSATPSDRPAGPSAEAPCGRMNVLLDIDETLVYFISGKVRGHSWDRLSPSEQAKYEYQTKGPTSGVLILRPHVRKFLAYLFRYFRVSLWTMSEREYAEDIAAALLKLFKRRGPHQRFANIFSADDDDDHDVSAKKLHGNNKDLNWLWYKYAKEYPCYAECNTILVDDLPANALNASNRHNAVKISPFALFGEVKARTDPYEDVSRDDVLLRLVEILKKVRRQQSDCYNRDEDRWYWVFREKNVRAMGLSDHYKPQEWKGETFRTITVDYKAPEKSKSPPAAPAPAAAAVAGPSEKPKKTKKATEKPKKASEKPAKATKKPAAAKAAAPRDAATQTEAAAPKRRATRGGNF